MPVGHLNVRNREIQPLKASVSLVASLWWLSRQVSCRRQLLSLWPPHIIQFTSLSGDSSHTHVYHELSHGSLSLICSFSPFLIPSHSICEPKSDVSNSSLQIMSGARDTPLSRKDGGMEVKSNIKWKLSLLEFWNHPLNSFRTSLYK